MPKAKCLALGHMANEGQSKKGKNCGSLPCYSSVLPTSGGCELWRRGVEKGFNTELSERQTPSYLLHYICLKYYVSFGIQTGFSV